MSTPRKRQQGAFTIAYALLLPTVLGIVALTLDAALYYLRGLQVQQLADRIAVMAAGSLNGTNAGMTNAVKTARLLVTDSSFWPFMEDRLEWNAAALTFAREENAPTGDWRSFGGSEDVSGVRFARVDTRQLGGIPAMKPFLMGVMGASKAAVNVGAVAIAGKRKLQVTPLAVCALQPAATDVRVNVATPPLRETIRHGFRYGVAYNLLDLNPAGTAGRYFLVDPIHGPGTEGGLIDEATVAPFMCSGTLGYGKIVTSGVRVREANQFKLWQQLNSRFDVYAGNPLCTPVTAPPDTNVRSYAGAGANWVNTSSGAGPATRSSAMRQQMPNGGALQTIADGVSPLPVSPWADYGPLWAYGPARAQDGSSVPSSKVAILYPGVPAASFVYGTSANQTPYLTLTQGPSRLGRANRRLLAIPLLDCSKPTTPTAKVLAVAQFFMTAPATATEVPGEFAGLVGEDAVATSVELVR